MCKFLPPFVWFFHLGILNNRILHLHHQADWDFFSSGSHFLSQIAAASAARTYVKGLLSRWFLKIFGPIGLETCMNLNSVLGSILLLSFFGVGFLLWVFKKWLMLFLKLTYLWGEMYLSYICVCLMRYWKAIHFARSIRHVAKRWNSTFELLNWYRIASFHWRKDPYQHFIE